MVEPGGLVTREPKVAPLHNNASSVLPLGRHVLIELMGCRFDAINEVGLVQDAMRDAALKAGATIRELSFHRFSPHGISGVVVIEESHLAIHTWPELNYAAVDLFTCGKSVDPWKAVEVLVSRFESTHQKSREFVRGPSDVVSGTISSSAEH